MATFLTEPAITPSSQRLFDDDVNEIGFVMNASTLWAYQPDTVTGLFDLLRSTKNHGGLTYRQLGILVTATASTLGDSYCSLAWGMKLAGASDPETAASVLSGDDQRLTEAESIMANWARHVVRDPNSTTQADVQELRDAGFDDAQIFAITVFVALRIAFSTVNDALGAEPDDALRQIVPGVVRDAVTYGRPIEATPARPDGT